MGHTLAHKMDHLGGRSLGHLLKAKDLHRIGSMAEILDDTHQLNTHDLQFCTASLPSR